jgi:LemA protein
MSAGAIVIITIICVIVLLTLLASYNALTQLRKDVRTAWSHLDEQLKRRYELVPELIQLLQSRGDCPVEKINAISAARNQAAIALNPAQLAEAESRLGTAIRAAFPTTAPEALRQRFVQNDRLLTGGVRAYNEAVRALNESICTFPTAYSARLVGLRFQPFFELRSGGR